MRIKCAHVGAGDEGGALRGERLVRRESGDRYASGTEAGELLQNLRRLLHQLSRGHEDEYFGAAASAAAGGLLQQFVQDLVGMSCRL